MLNIVRAVEKRLYTNLPKSILVSELTHSSLFLLQAKLMVSEKKKLSMNEIITRLMIRWDNQQEKIHAFDGFAVKLENIET